MPYGTANIKKNSLLRDSQPQLLENFTQISNLINVNHFPFGDANQGFHTVLTLPIQSNTPETLIDTVNLFCTSTTDFSPLTLSVIKNGGNNINFMDFHGGPPYNVNGFGLEPFGYFILPSGIIIKWASCSFDINAPTVPPTIVYNLAWDQFDNNIPFTTSQLWAVVTPQPDLNSMSFSDIQMYVTSIANINTIQFSMFQRDEFQQSLIGPKTVKIIAIAIGF